MVESNGCDAAEHVASACSSSELVQRGHHDCPAKGISSQVDSDGIDIAEEAWHNQIVYARCACVEWSGNDCSIPPPPPPTVEPWPDPQAASAGRGRRGSWRRSLLVPGAGACWVSVWLWVETPTS